MRLDREILYYNNEQRVKHSTHLNYSKGNKVMFVNRQSWSDDTLCKSWSIFHRLINHPIMCMCIMNQMRPFPLDTSRTAIFIIWVVCVCVQTRGHCERLSIVLSLCYCSRSCIFYRCIVGDFYFCWGVHIELNCRRIIRFGVGFFLAYVI